MYNDAPPPLDQGVAGEFPRVLLYLMVEAGEFRGVKKDSLLSDNPVYSHRYYTSICCNNHDDSNDSPTGHPGPRLV